MWLGDVAHPLWVMPSSSSPGVEIGMSTDDEASDAASSPRVAAKQASDDV